MVLPTMKSLLSVCGTSRHHFNHQPTRNHNSQKRSKALKSAYEAKMGAKRVTSVCALTICRSQTFSLSIAMHELKYDSPPRDTLAGMASFYQVTKYDTAKMSSNVVRVGKRRWHFTLSLEPSLEPQPHHSASFDTIPHQIRKA